MNLGKEKYQLDLSESGEAKLLYNNNLLFKAVNFALPDSNEEWYITLQVSEINSAKTNCFTKEFNVNNDVQVAQFKDKARLKLKKTGINALELGLNTFIQLLIEYKESFAVKDNPNVIKIETEAHSSDTHTRIMNYLTSDNVTDIIEGLFDNCNSNGKQNTLLYLISIGRLLEKPISALLTGDFNTSQNILNTIDKAIDKEHKHTLTSLAPSALYNINSEDALSQKVVFVKKIDKKGRELKTLQESTVNQQIRRLSSVKNETGNYEAKTKLIDTKFTLLGYLENESDFERFQSNTLLIKVRPENNETSLQNYLLEEAGEIDEGSQFASYADLRFIQKQLKPFKVRLPFLGKLKLPTAFNFSPNTIKIIVELTKCITLLNQYNLKVNGFEKKDENNIPYLEAQPLHFIEAIDLLYNIMVDNCSRLRLNQLELLNHLKELSRQKKGFKETDILSNSHLRKSQVNNIIRDLLDYGFIKIIDGNKKKGWEYALTDKQDGQVLEQALKELKAQVSNYVSNEVSNDVSSKFPTSLKKAKTSANTISSEENNNKFPINKNYRETEENNNTKNTIENETHSIRSTSLSTHLPGLWSHAQQRKTKPRSSE